MRNWDEDRERAMIILCYSDLLSVLFSMTLCVHLPLGIVYLDLLNGPRRSEPAVSVISLSDLGVVRAEPRGHTSNIVRTLSVRQQLSYSLGISVSTK